MIIPTALFPSSLNTEWGMEQEQCLSRLKTSIIKVSQRYISFELLEKDKRYIAILLFNSQNKLRRIELDLHMSKRFRDDEDYLIEEMEGVRKEYEGYYDRIVEHYKVILGPPVFSGAWQTDGYPEDQTAAHITYWIQPQGHFQAEYDHPDKELPFFVRIATYPVS